MAESSERILVTGGLGFIGRNLINEFLHRKDTLIVTSRNLNRKNIPNSTLNRIELHSTNISNRSEIASLISETKPDVIIHLAGTIGNGCTEETINEVNFGVTKNLLDCCLDSNVRRIILLGSADEYGYQELPTNEESDLKPLTPYAISKAKANEYALNLFEKWKLPIVILRPFTGYGYFQPVKMFLNQAISSALSNESFEMTLGQQKRDYVFVTDIINAISASIEKSAIDGQIFNIGTGESTALAEIAKKIWEIVGADTSKLRIGARKSNVSELHDTCANTEKARKVLNWKSTVSLNDGLFKTVDWTRNRLNE
jgi:UDP-glucose 4-epimerase